MTVGNGKEAHGHLVALEELIHRFGTRMETNEDFLINWLNDEAAQRAIVMMQLGDTR